MLKAEYIVYLLNYINSSFKRTTQWGV